jgi:NTP-dependent ternary system trypsin peptidase co-occuring protein
MGDRGGQIRWPSWALGRRPVVKQLELAETVEALRAELAQAAAEGADTGFQFPVTGVQLEFHVGVTKTGEGRGGVKFYVVELGGAAGYAREELQTVTVTLGGPVDQNGEPVKIYRGFAQKP